ncbi:hypothetical protein [Streptomyces sp. NPDC058726]|uniref:hypothetical protein n=1 Tax=Streptomyces sp. NPDC058726 TaxID=3346611 RepID=UPI00369B3A16
MAWDLSREYRVSFSCVDGIFRCALQRSRSCAVPALEPYGPTWAGLAFARRFIGWETLEHGVERVDACWRTGGGLLLVELGDSA